MWSSVTPPRRAVWLAVMLLTPSLLPLVGCGRGKHEAPRSAEAAPRSVRTVPVTSTLTTSNAEVPGTVHAIREARVAPKLMAKVLTVHVREGDRVKRGQILLTLDGRDIEAQVAQAAASVDAAKAAHAQAQTALEMQKVTSSVEVQQAEAALRAAQANLEKVKRGPRKEQRDQAEQAVKMAQAALDAAEAQLSLVREGARKQQKAQADEAVQQAEQGVETARQGVVAAEAAFQTAEADYNRMKALADQDVVPKQRLDHARMQYEATKAQLAQAKAGHEQARSSLEQARQQADMVHEGARTQEVQEAEQGVAQARAALEQAKLGLVMADKGGREEDIAAAEAQVRQAEEAVRNAKAAQARDKLRESDVVAARAGIGQAKAGLTAASVMKSYTHITAPLSGVVSARTIDPGSMASPGLPVLTIEDDSEYRLEATVPENLAPHLRVGGTVRAVIAVLGADWEAEVVEIVPAADPASHTFVAKAKLPRDDRVRSGIFGRLVLATGERRSITVPEAAIWRRGSLTGVFVIEDGHARLRMVQVGSPHDGTVEINSGLGEGEVIAATAAGLEDGVPVTAGGENAP